MRFYEDADMRRYFMVFRAVIIGASDGEETNIVVVNWYNDSVGTFHDEPISVREMEAELRRMGLTKTLEELQEHAEASPQRS